MVSPSREVFRLDRKEVVSPVSLRLVSPASGAGLVSWSCQREVKGGGGGSREEGPQKDEGVQQKVRVKREPKLERAIRQ
jgi:hypothetical protein